MRWMSTNPSSSSMTLVSLLYGKGGKIKAFRAQDQSIIGILCSLLHSSHIFGSFFWRIWASSETHYNRCHLKWWLVFVKTHSWNSNNTSAVLWATCKTKQKKKHFGDSGTKRRQKELLCEHVCASTYMNWFIVCVGMCVCLHARVCLYRCQLGRFNHLTLEDVLWCCVKDSWAQMKGKIPHIIWL